jgi:exopolyphosphatase/guanosine-5'-triphosphate,3'-diphosphate pyrophosphatase
MRVDVMDLGSNTFHLLSAKVIAGCIVPLNDMKVAVRLGERAFADGRIPQACFQRGVDAVAMLLAPLRGRRPITVATGVFREVSNGDAFLDEVRRRYDLDVQLISGEEEANLTYRGVRAEEGDPDARIAVFDLGGGSLECMLGEAGRLELVRSLPLGALRLATRFAGGPIAARVRETVQVTAGSIVEAIRQAEPDAVVLSSGTARSLLRITRRLGWTEQVVGCIRARRLVELAQQLVVMTPDEIIGLGVSPARCDTIAAGAMVLATIVEQLRVPFVRIAQGALREGLALYTADAHASASRAWTVTALSQNALRDENRSDLAPICFRPVTERRRA